MRSGFYGYGFNVGTTSGARTQVSHSGAFELGSGTNFLMLPSADVAIVVLTNATPSGVPETLTAEFADLVQFGEVREDWYTPYHAAFVQMEQPVGSLVGQQPPANPAPPAPLASYVGEYANAFWGPARVTEQDGRPATGARPETDRPAEALGRQRVHVQLRRRERATGHHLEGDVRREQAEARVLRQTARARSCDERLREERAPMSACAKSEHR